MRFSSIAAAAICVVGILGSVRCASAAETQQVSGPVAYQNLAVYFIHGASAMPSDSPKLGFVGRTLECFFILEHHSRRMFRSL